MPIATEPGKSSPVGELLERLVLPIVPVGVPVTAPPPPPSRRPIAPTPTMPSMPSMPGVPAIRIDGTHSSAPASARATRPSGPPAPTSVRYSSGGISIEEIVKLSPRSSLAPAPKPAPSVAPNAGSSSVHPPQAQSLTEDELIARLGSLAIIPKRTGTTPPGLDHRGGFILSFVDGMSSFEDIIDASGLPKGDALRLLHDLLTSSAILVG
jgi:hypothetical protein